MNARVRISNRMQCPNLGFLCRLFTRANLDCVRDNVDVDLLRTLHRAKLFGRALLVADLSLHGASSKQAVAVRTALSHFGFRPAIDLEVQSISFVLIISVLFFTGSALDL
jgi:hypothetical protein